MKYPSDLEFLEFFGVEPMVDDDITTFTVLDSVGMSLKLSFNVAGDSLQTSLSLHRREIAIISHEQMTRFRIDGNVLSAEFVQSDVKVRAVIKICPFISIQWYGLRTV
jgi:hypothetical protein